MDNCPLSFVAASCGGELRQGAPDSCVRRVCTDSRQTQPGDLFVALRGERFDGHDFVADAAGRGAAAVLVEEARQVELPPACGLVAVADTRRALGRLAEAYRARFDLPVVAVGGSNGKTTTKELVAAVLQQQFPTLWSEASFNNDIGVPLTLLRLDSSHRAAVVELGTNHPGELARLVPLARPRFGIITNIGREHLEFFGDLNGVVAEEGTLAEGLPAEGVLLVNGDSPWADALARRTAARVVRVGLGQTNDWRASDIRLDASGLTFHADGPAAALAGEYRLPLLGRHQVVNALFALAVGHLLGLGRAAIQRGLAACKPAARRLQLWEHNGVRVLDDSYNANPDSMRAALETLVQLPCQGRRVAVLGDMAELGAQSEAAHAEVGRCAAELGVGQLFAVGRFAPVMARAARAAGLTRVLEFPEVEPAARALKQFARPGDLVLVKASRATRLERVADALRGNGKKGP